MDKQVEIPISLSIIKDRLKNIFKSGGEPYPDLVTDVIIDNLETTEKGLTQLLLAFMGIQEKTAWVVGDECMVYPDKIPSYYYERKETEEAGLLYKGHLKGTIMDIDFTKKKSIKFRFRGMYKSGAKIEERDIDHDIAVEDLRSDHDLVLKRPDIADIL